MYRTICDCLQSFHRHKNREPSGISLFLAMIPTARLIRRIHPVAFCSVQIRLFFHPPSHVSSAMPSINQITISTCFVQPEPASQCSSVDLDLVACSTSKREKFVFLSFFFASRVCFLPARAHTCGVGGFSPQHPQLHPPAAPKK